MAPCRLRYIMVAVAPGVAACAPTDSPDASALVARDSAGVRIVDVDWPSALEGVDTLVLAEPMLRVGVRTGDASYEFDNIVAVVPLGEVGFAAADAGRSDVRLFDWNGVLVTAYGREGDGPGEFRRIQYADRYVGDSIVIYDSRADRLTVFPVHGGAPRTFLAYREAEARPPILVGSLPDGRLITRRRTTVSGDGLLRRDIILEVASPIGEPESTIGRFPGDQYFTHRADGFVASMLAPFPVQTFAAPLGDGVVVVDGAQPRVTFFNSAGVLERVWRSDESRASLPTAIADTHRDSLLGANPMPPGMAEPWANAIQALSLFSVSDGRAFGVATDEFDVEYVEVFELPSSRGPSPQGGADRR